MPPGSKKRKAAKKKQEQASSTLTNHLKSNNHDSKRQGERESDDGVNSQENYKKSGSTEEDTIRIEKDNDGRIEITDSSHDHDKSSSSSSSSSSSDDESREVKKNDDNKEAADSVPEVITVSSVPNQPMPIAGDAPFMGSTANAIVENTGLMDSTVPSDPNFGEHIKISHVDTIISNEAEEKPLPTPTEMIAAEVSVASDEIRHTSSGANDSDVKENEGKTSPLPESKGVSESSRDSEVVISHEEEVSVRPTHGIAQRTSWFSCCGLFDVATGSNR